jgi:hypothetical protein
MIISILAICLSLLPDPQTPNFYPGLTHAREASRKSQKEMIIFFTDKSCSNCESAWTAYTKDPEATSRYISTKMDIDDFDGGIFFELLTLQQVPSWVILHPDGTEKERWEGGWKDKSGNPLLFDTNPIIAKSENTTTNQSIPKASPSEKTHQASFTDRQSMNPASTQALESSSGYYLQAGYFGSESNALKMIDELKRKGINSFEIKTGEQNGTVFYRVATKTFNLEIDAQAEQSHLSKMSIPTSLKKL